MAREPCSFSAQVGEIVEAVLGDDEFGDQIHDHVDLALIDAQHARQPGAFAARLGRDANGRGGVSGGAARGCWRAALRLALGTRTRSAAAL